MHSVGGRSYAKSPLIRANQFVCMEKAAGANKRRSIEIPPSLFLQDVPDGRGDRAHLRLLHPLLLRPRLPLHLGLPLRVS